MVFSAAIDSENKIIYTTQNVQKKMRQNCHC